MGFMKGTLKDLVAKLKYTFQDLTFMLSEARTQVVTDGGEMM